MFDLIEQESEKLAEDQGPQRVGDIIIPDEFKTKPNLDRKSSETTNDQASVASSLTGISKVSAMSSSKLSSRKKPETVRLKDRDWRGESGGEMWWECLWEGMDGIGGTNKKGSKCFDRVRIWWRDIPG
jgi:hypothetical protein